MFHLARMQTAVDFLVRWSISVKYVFMIHLARMQTAVDFLVRWYSC
jgi:hypothetical protein